MGPNGDPMDSWSIERGLMYYTHICNSHELLKLANNLQTFAIDNL